MGLHRLCLHKNTAQIQVAIEPRPQLTCPGLSSFEAAFSPAHSSLDSTPGWLPHPQIPKWQWELQAQLS